MQILMFNIINFIKDGVKKLRFHGESKLRKCE